MTFNNPQAPRAVVMVRPQHFHTNPQTAGDNGFQKMESELTPGQQAKIAYSQVTNMKTTLESKGVTVHLFDDATTQTPDSVFPNNWFSTHAGGHVAIYPMYAENRRLERRVDIIDMLKAYYRVQDVVDYSGLEYDEIYLEGTGAMVLDHLERVVYAARSNRANPLVLERFCSHFNYEPMLFDAVDSSGLPVYHTNVLMCIGTEFVMLGLDLVQSEKRKRELVQRFLDSGRQVIGLSNQQINQFCGNAIELIGNGKKLLALSTTAAQALTEEQRAILQQSVELVPLDVTALESAGGSVRCMLAGVHLSRR